VIELYEGERLIWRGHPSWRADLGYFIRWGLLSIIPIAIAGILKANGHGTGFAYWIWVLITIGFWVLIVVVDVLRRAGADYYVTSRRLHIRRGILSRRDQSTHIDRVQNVNTTQRPLDRLLNVGTVDFDTAGTEAQEASFRFWGVAAPHDLARVVETFLAQLRERAQAPGDGVSA